MILSIIVPNYNGENLLSHCLKFWNEESKLKTESEIIIVDNASTDKSEMIAKESYPKVKFFKLDRNYGFTRACNYGSKQAKGKYLLFLNNDCLIDWENIESLVNYLEENEKLVATQPIIRNESKQIENIGYTVDLKRAKAWVIKNINCKFEAKLSFEDNYFYGLSGTCLLIRKEVFEKVGMFDESFHSYLEDVDLFFRLIKNGYKYFPCENASCIHQHMATSSRMGNYKQKQDFKNWIRIIIKNYPLKYKIKYFPSLLIERIRNLNGVIKNWW